MIHKTQEENNEMKKEEEKLYTEAEAADYFGWSVFTMREIRKRNEIEHLVFNGRTIRYTREQLEAYKDEHVLGGSENE